MNFEQMKVIWDSQDQRPLYAVDEAALHASVRRGSRGFRHLIELSHVSIVATWAALAALYLVAPLTEGEHLHQLGVAAILLALAAGQAISMIRRRRADARFDESLRGDLDRAVWRIEHDIAWARSLRRAYVPLFLVAISIDLALRLTPGLAVVWAGTIALVAGVSWALDWEIRSIYLPRKRRYETIRAKLIESEQ
jgi:membrane protein implicated in regulation of membrane protease activity